MKKAILFWTILALTISVKAQNINIPVKDVIAVIEKPVYKTATINIKTDSVIKIDTFQAVVKEVEVKDSTIHVQNRTIADKTTEVKELKDTTIPVGTGNYTYLIIGIAVLLLIVFFATKTSWSKYITLREIDLIKGFKTAFLMALLTGTGNIINTGVFPTDLKTWKFILLTALSAGLVYLIKNAFTPDKKTEAKTVKMPETINNLLYERFRNMSEETLINLKKGFEMRSNSTTSEEYQILCKVIEQKTKPEEKISDNVPN